MVYEFPSKTDWEKKNVMEKWICEWKGKLFFCFVYLTSRLLINHCFEMYKCLAVSHFRRSFLLTIFMSLFSLRFPPPSTQPPISHFPLSFSSPLHPVLLSPSFFSMSSFPLPLSPLPFPSSSTFTPSPPSF